MNFKCFELISVSMAVDLSKGTCCNFKDTWIETLPLFSSPHESNRQWFPYLGEVVGHPCSTMCWSYPGVPSAYHILQQPHIVAVQLRSSQRLTCPLSQFLASLVQGEGIALGSTQSLPAWNFWVGRGGVWFVSINQSRWLFQSRCRCCYVWRPCCCFWCHRGSSPNSVAHTGRILCLLGPGWRRIVGEKDWYRLSGKLFSIYNSFIICECLKEWKLSLFLIFFTFWCAWVLYSQSLMITYFLYTYTDIKNNIIHLFITELL